LTHTYGSHSVDIVAASSSAAIAGDLLGPRPFASTYEAFEYIGSVVEVSAERWVVATARITFESDYSKSGTGSTFTLELEE
jgi:hypothetical protein